MTAASFLPAFQIGSQQGALEGAEVAGEALEMQERGRGRDGATQGELRKVITMGNTGGLSAVQNVDHPSGPPPKNLLT